MVSAVDVKQRIVDMADFLRHPTRWRFTPTCAGRVYSEAGAGASVGGGGGGCGSADGDSVGGGAGVSVDSDSLEGGAAVSAGSASLLVDFAVVVADFFGVGGVTSAEHPHDAQPRTIPTVATAYSNFAMRRKYRRPHGRRHGAPFTHHKSGNIASAASIDRWRNIHHFKQVRATAKGACAKSSSPQRERARLPQEMQDRPTHG